MLAHEFREPFLPGGVQPGGRLVEQPDRGGGTASRRERKPAPLPGRR